MALSKETLAKIHELLATEMVERLENGSVVRTKDGELVNESISAAEMNVIRQFLKDNGIDKGATPDTGDTPFDRLVTGVDASINAMKARTQ